MPLIHRTDSDRWVLVASKGGAPDHPSWYQNLEADPTATIQVNNTLTVAPTAIRFANIKTTLQTAGCTTCHISTNGPLTALADGVDGGQGVYVYNATSAFPNLTFNSENYWVDVVFNAAGGGDITPPTVSAVTPVNGAGGVAITSGVTATFTETMTASTVASNTFELRDASGALVPATVTYNAATRTATLQPTAALGNSTIYTATVKGGWLNIT